MDDKTDTRNVVDEFKGMSQDDIITALDARGSTLEIAIENLTRDYNMGTIVRSANAFGVRRVHIIGSRQWNKRGAMMTDTYLHVQYHASVAEFVASVTDSVLVAVDNVPGSTAIESTDLPPNSILVFGAEGPGLSADLLSAAHSTVAITQSGSTRSLNVGVAAGIAMYEWTKQNT